MEKYILFKKIRVRGTRWRRGKQEAFGELPGLFEQLGKAEGEELWGKDGGGGCGGIVHDIGSGYGGGGTEGSMSVMVVVVLETVW